MKRVCRCLGVLLAVGLCCIGRAQGAEGIPCLLALDEQTMGICIRQVPEKGQLRLGNRQVEAGDILTPEQAEKLVFAPEGREDGSLSFQLWEPQGLGDLETVFLNGRNRAPIAEDSALETYRNLPVEGKLRVREPEGEPMTLTLVEAPRRGRAELRPDGSCLYTPDKNKVGPDAFTYRAMDPRGQGSREARVTVEILKPTDAPQYVDTLGSSCRFAAEWMKHTGLFSGEMLGDSLCFRPEQPVTRGEFLTVLVKALELPLEAGPDMPRELADLPGWFQPYAWAALRSGLFAPLSGPDTFDPEIPITRSQAEAMVDGALDREVFRSQEPDPVLTRAQGAELLYQAFGIQ